MSKFPQQTNKQRFFSTLRRASDTTGSAKAKTRAKKKSGDYNGKRIRQGSSANTSLKRRGKSRR